MKLVSVHKLFYILIILMLGLDTVQAQVWTLHQCIESAQENNMSLQIGKNNIAISEFRHKESKANLLPKVIANVDYKYFTNLPYQLMPLSTFNPAAQEGQFREAQFGVPHNINANLQFSMILYNPQVYGSIKTTKVATELAELQFRKSEEQIYFEISNLYYNAQILHHQMIFIDSNLVNAERLLINMQLLKEQLLAKGTDVGKVELQVAQLTTQKEIVLSKYDQVLNALKFTIGIPIEQNLQIEPEIMFPKSIEYKMSITLDMQIVKTQNNLLAGEISTLNKSRFLPSLNLIGSYGATGFGYDKQPNSFLNFYPIGFAGIQLSFPLFNGTVTNQKINQKKIEVQNNELQFGLITDQSNMQTENAKSQIKVAHYSIETTKEQIKLANEIYQQTILQQKQGLANLTDVILADNTLREAQQSYLSSVIDYLKADLELKKVTGNLSIKN